jgi:hypothetical protein
MNTVLLNTKVPPTMELKINLQMCNFWRSVQRVLVGKPEGKIHWVDQDVDGRIILKWIFRKWEGFVGTGWSWLRIGTGGGRL